MNVIAPHRFHIPVMGLGFTIDTPLKVARFGISSALSIVEDELIERMREFYCKAEDLPYHPIINQDIDSRAKRITAYLNLLDELVKKQVRKLQKEDFLPETEISKYFEMLPNDAPLKARYKQMLSANGNEKKKLQDQLRTSIQAGDIDVNIMTKVDKTNYDKEGKPLPSEYTDALAALRGFANSTLHASVIFSAGMNPRLYSYCELFEDFFPKYGQLPKKKIILKVSDYRSAWIQGKFLAKKGLWVSEFRIESGLNCGGHAFATEGLLMGPILEEFKTKRHELRDELLVICNQSLRAKGLDLYQNSPPLKITAQGGLGTYGENQFLLEYYQLDSIGWGSPFLLVPEATNVDDETLQQLATAQPSDYYLSHSSPLGVPFNNFRKSSSEAQRKNRIIKNRPGSPCYKKFLSTNTEFTEKPICTASRQYQNQKIKQILSEISDLDMQQEEIRKVTEKDCLCEGLGAPALLRNHLHPAHNLKAVTICPGPNLAFFSGIHTLKEMVDHIYGRTNLLQQVTRPHVLINELKIYIKYLTKDMEENVQPVDTKKEKYWEIFRNNLKNGIAYYRDLSHTIGLDSSALLDNLEQKLEQLSCTSAVSIGSRR
ncbi:MAG TPA: hypothetical protein VK014_05850 [Cyclobacteriaceae bacterium]|nr:hypothetical protein [Cyclobacteriaceae bacterium]